MDVKVGQVWARRYGDHQIKILAIVPGLAQTYSMNTGRTNWVEIKNLLDERKYILVQEV